MVLQGLCHLLVSLQVDEFYLRLWRNLPECSLKLRGSSLRALEAVPNSTECSNATVPKRFVGPQKFKAHLNVVTPQSEDDMLASKVVESMADILKCSNAAARRQYVRLQGCGFYDRLTYMQ